MRTAILTTLIDGRVAAKEFWQWDIDGLVRAGLARRTGEKRDGKRVYEMTERGSKRERNRQIATTEMQARFMFDNREAMELAKVKLMGLGFEVEVLDWTDPEGGPYVWMRVYTSVDYDDGARFFDWMSELSKFTGGGMIEAGLRYPV
jgi:hypothetical protein